MKITSKIIKTIDGYAKNYDSEFDILITKDSNDNKYYYIHFKPRDSKSSFNETVSYLKKMKIRYSIPLHSDWKSVIYIPINQKLNYIIHSPEEVYTINKYKN